METPCPRLGGLPCPRLLAEHFQTQRHQSWLAAHPPAAHPAACAQLSAKIASLALRGHRLPPSPRTWGKGQVSLGRAQGSVRSPPQGPQPPLSPWPRHGRAAFPIPATASGHCRRGLPAASVLQTVLAARWLLRCSGERGGRRRLCSRSGPRGLRATGAVPPPKHPAAFFFLFVLLLASRCLAGFVLVGFFFIFFFF